MTGRVVNCNEEERKNIRIGNESHDNNNFLNKLNTKIIDKTEVDSRWETKLALTKVMKGKNFEN